MSSNLHRDSRNGRGSKNYCVTFGQDQGGGLWLEVEDPTEDEVNQRIVAWKKDKTGAWVPGKYYETNEHFIAFDPFLKHASSTWQGDRWGLVFHTVRQHEEGSEHMKKLLKNCGFPMPRKPTTHASESKRSNFPKKGKRNEIANTAGKLSVLFATLLTASSSYIAELQGPLPPADPIVMMEIGGREGTLEAVELGKSVVEPMDWSPREAEDSPLLCHGRFAQGATGTS